MEAKRIGPALCAVVLLCLTSLPIWGCRGGDRPLPSSQAGPPAQEAVQETSKQPSPTPTADTGDAGFSVSILTLTQEPELSITYPQLSGLRDAEAQRRLNERFFQDAVLSTEDAADGSTGYARWETASQSERLASLVFTCYWETPGAAHPYSGCTTLNLDPASGQALRLGQLCHIEAIAAELAAASGVSGQTAYRAVNPFGEDVTRAVTMEEILQANSFLLPEGMEPWDEGALAALLESTDDESIPECGRSYWRDGQLHLVFSFYHSTGDYLDITVTNAHQK